MLDQGVNSKSFVLSVLFSLFILCFYIVKYSFFTNDFFVVCDVGQGDGLYFRVNNNDIIIDSGSGRDMLYCLGKYMPFWDKKIELALLTHPQKDHYGGFLFILDEYNIDRFILPSVYNSKAESYKQFLSKLYSKAVIKKEVLFSGDYINIGDSAVLLLFWPSKGFVNENIVKSNALAFDNKYFYDTSLDLNLFSYTGLFYTTKGDKRVLLTGDINKEILVSLLKQYNSLVQQVDYLKQPHHGSKTGFDDKIFNLAKIDNVLISVGTSNPYDHPSDDLIDYLNLNKINFLRTDIQGNIVINLN